MKIETVIIITKGLCFTVIGFTAPIAAGLAQYANTNEWPSKIVWVVIGIAAVAGGATQLLSFLSGSFSQYMAAKNTDATTGEVTFTKPLEPQSTPTNTVPGVPAKPTNP